MVNKGVLLPCTKARRFVKTAPMRWPDQKLHALSGVSIFAPLSKLAKGYGYHISAILTRAIIL